MKAKIQESCRKVKHLARSEIWKARDQGGKGSRRPRNRKIKDQKFQVSGRSEIRLAKDTCRIPASSPWPPSALVHTGVKYSSLPMPVFPVLGLKGKELQTLVRCAPVMLVVGLLLESVGLTGGLPLPFPVPWEFALGTPGGRLSSFLLLLPCGWFPRCYQETRFLQN